MSGDILRRIKRAVLSGNYAFSKKAIIEMEADYFLISSKKAL